MNTTCAATGLSRLMQLTAGDLISGEAVVVASHATMHEAACQLAEHCIGLAPVVDESGRCIGVIGARDFVTFEIDREGDFVPANARRPNVSTDGLCLPWNSVLRFMATAVQTIRFDAPFQRVSEIMLAEHIHHLVVLDSVTQPIGVLSTLDVVSALTAIHDEENARLSK